ncbi:MAG: hypothetical protein L6R28_13850 [Planctomycetes bacterium]|nr:hypothetical protein [Planctomycetota bacterium]
MNARTPTDSFQIHLSTCVAELMALNLAIYINVQAIGGMLGAGFSAGALMLDLTLLVVLLMLAAVACARAWAARGRGGWSRE